MQALALLSCLVSIAPGQAPPITSASILAETSDLSRLTKRPNPYYTTAQASSYDRKSVKPGTSDWFANGDAGQFIRVEERDGRKERVMADLTGPGAVVRIWSANPGGVLRFYFDGAADPQVTIPTADLFKGKLASLGAPFSYEASKGWDFYYPLPYAKSLKITVDDSDGDKSRSMYYHVGYRTYEPGTAVTTFDPQSIDDKANEKYAAQITNPYVPGYVKDLKRIQVGAGKTNTARLPDGPRAVTYLYVVLNPQKLPKGAGFDDPNQVYNQLRTVILEANFDGQECIRVPLGDFFGAAPGIHPFRCFPMQVGVDGGMICRFVMPYAKTALIRFRNVGKASAQIGYFVETFRYPWDDSSYHFMAQWTGEHGRTRPIRDMNFLTTAGEGVFVGDNLHVSNPSPAWWGEGDEKIYVDGETFPSTFGTGTEDYYGYAWSSNQPFVEPFHAQPFSESPGNFGNSFVERFHIMDPIHFRKSFRFDLEMWHWADVLATYVHTAYWYEKPDGSSPAKIDPKLLTIYELKPPAPIKGALEGEALKILARSAGKTESQTGFWDTSGQSQLWWTGAAPGDRLTLEVPVAKGGRYRVSGHFCFAKDYGVAKLTLGGKTLKTVDFYSPDLTWKTLDFGLVDLPEGTAPLIVEIVGTNPAANPKSYMFGLDYLKLDSK